MDEAVSHHEALVELLAGRPDVAEAHLRPGYEALERMGERAVLATTAAMLAQAVYLQGRHAEAAVLCRESERHASPEDVATQAMWRGVAAKIHADGGAARRGGGDSRARRCDSSSRPTCSTIAATSCSTWPRSCGSPAAPPRPEVPLDGRSSSTSARAISSPPREHGPGRP